MGHAVIWYSLGSPPRLGLRLNLVVGEIDHLWGLGFGLEGSELRQRLVRLRGTEMAKVDRENPV